MPTLRGLRRRGYPPKAIRECCRAIGTTRNNSVEAIEELGSFVRRELNATAQRHMAVLRQLALAITNWPTGAAGAPLVEFFELLNNPENPADGVRTVAFCGELWIEHDDCAEVPPAHIRPAVDRQGRAAPRRLCRHGDRRDQGRRRRGRAGQRHLRSGQRGGDAPDGRTVKSTMHRVSAAHALDVEACLDKRLFTAANPGERTGEPLDDPNPASLELLTGCKVEGALSNAKPGSVVQFERLGYSCRDAAEPLVFHRTVGLRDEFAAAQRRAG